jgi:hypothetical protein
MGWPSRFQDDFHHEVGLSSESRIFRLTVARLLEIPCCREPVWRALGRDSVRIERPSARSRWCLPLFYLLCPFEIVLVLSVGTLTAWLPTFLSP